MKTSKQCERTMLLINRLEAGEEVSRGSLSRVLTPEQMADLDKGWKAEQVSRQHPKPREIKKYEAMLKRGLLLYGKYEATHHKLAAYDSRRLIESAESALEKAWEFAQEMVQNTNSLQEWLDRDPNDCDGFTPASMPRVVTSKSADNQSALKKAPGTHSKKQLKLIALQNALEELQPNDLELLSQEIKSSKVATRREFVMEFEGFKF
jgi:hypothetical protein